MRSVLAAFRARLDEGLGPWWAGLLMVVVVGLGVLILYLSVTIGGSALDIP